MNVIRLLVDFDNSIALVLPHIANTNEANI